MIFIGPGIKAYLSENFEENTSNVTVVPSFSATNIILNGKDQGWDTYAMPADVWRTLRNTTSSEAVVLLMTPGDARKTIHWAPDVLAAAADAGATAGPAGLRTSTSAVLAWGVADAAGAPPSSVVTVP